MCATISSLHCHVRDARWRVRQRSMMRRVPHFQEFYRSQAEPREGVGVMGGHRRRTPMSLIVISNRVARPKADEPMNGGLAAALLPAVTTAGAIWVGSSGRLSEGTDKKEPFAEIQALGAGALATVDLPATQYRGFYQ